MRESLGNFYLQIFNPPFSAFSKALGLDVNTLKSTAEVLQLKNKTICYSIQNGFNILSLSFIFLLLSVFSLQAQVHHVEALGTSFTIIPHGDIAFFDSTKCNSYENTIITGDTGSEDNHRTDLYTKFKSSYWRHVFQSY